MRAINKTPIKVMAIQVTCFLSILLTACKLAVEFVRLLYRLGLINVAGFENNGEFATACHNGDALFTVDFLERKLNSYCSYDPIALEIQCYQLFQQRVGMIRRILKWLKNS